MDVLEQPDGQLRVRHFGEIVPSQLAPPRPGALRAASGTMALDPDLGRTVANLAGARLSRTQMISLSRLESQPSPSGEGVRRDQAAVPKRKPTPRRFARWQAVQKAKLPGHSLRAIARNLGVSRNTVRRHAYALTAPMNPPRSSAIEDAHRE